jgi:hypothetical protein
MKPRTKLPVVLLLAAMVLAGCDKGTEAPAAPAPAAPAPAARAAAEPGAKLPAARSPGLALLRKAVLTKADLPGWKKGAGDEVGNPTGEDNTCGITTARGSVVRAVDGGWWDQPGRSGTRVGSYVQLRRGESDIRADLAKVSEPKVRRCLALDVAAATRQVIAQLAWHTEWLGLPKGLRGVGMRLKFAVATANGLLPAYLDLVLIANRRVETTFVSYSLGRPFDPDLHDSLIRALGERARRIA